MGQRLVYAAFLSRFGSPVDALHIAAALSALPVKAENAEADAVLQTRSPLGSWRVREPFDAVIAFDPGNATALRARTELELGKGKSGASSRGRAKARDGLADLGFRPAFLAKAFAAAGNKPAVDRTLWTAFRDIPGDDQHLCGTALRREGNPIGLAIFRPNSAASVMPSFARDYYDADGR